MLIRFDITNVRRLCYFMSQSYFETEGYTKWEENLNYRTAERLPEVWPTHFTMDQSNTEKAYAPDYINNPEKLANMIYANRYGNGNVASGDGWKYRGQGAFNLTFADNYKAASQALFSDYLLYTNPALVGTDFETRWLTAGWFWNTHHFNAVADADQFTAMTTTINGSPSTVPERLEVLHKAQNIFKE